jgi:hypothetical protein
VEIKGITSASFCRYKKRFSLILLAVEENERGAIFLIEGGDKQVSQKAHA